MKCTGGGDRPRVRAVERQHSLLDDVEQADRRDDRGFRVIVEAAQHEPVGQERHRADRERRGDQREQESTERMANQARTEASSVHRFFHSA